MTELVQPDRLEPLGRDRGRVEEVFAELYLLGVRPTMDEVRSYLDALPSERTTWKREIAQLWRRRLADPLRSPRRAGGWVVPFYVPDVVAQERGLRPIREQLADALAVAALALSS